MNICKHILDNLENLFECDPHGEYVRIETPFIYPDGDIIDLYYKSKDPLFAVLTDLGGTHEWLSAQILSQGRSQKQNDQIKDICLTYRIEYRGGEFFIDMGKGNEQRNISEAVFDLSQAIIRVASLWFVQLDRVRNDALNSVEMFLDLHDFQYEKNKKIQGTSGQNWKLDFCINHPNKTSYLCLLSTEKKNNTRNIINRIYTTWGDLRELKENDKSGHLQFISLLDDRYPVWTSKQKKLLKDADSIVKNFSNRNDIKNTLAGIT
ncbi:DUF1828 domain-containing protein [Picosynechococcus sp. PCC 11901]|uniref:DUF1828 domain-containing protein n=1 Tax=unclassified Picosynechococcus TaxID=3079910 RepID=UPI000810B41B|nr:MULTISPECIES: DUF1828 domain-containing protein [unclassified Picosynechococcus]ANV86323.1 hypothetical protein AWQ22_01885 [Picosynechococcus sp. PCC 7117]QCS49002.1 DUF1828 domain-containing protein [Picosynechococcus sp. PCC 11901]